MQKGETKCLTTKRTPRSYDEWRKSELVIYRRRLANWRKIDQRRYKVSVEKQKISVQVPVNWRQWAIISHVTVG